MKTDTPLIPVLACALAIFLLSVMDAVMKGLVLGIGVYSTILWRCTLASVVAGAAWSTGPRIWPSPRVMKLHVLRAAMVGCVLLLFFWGLARLPLAEAIALSFIAPLIALFMAAVLLGERIRRTAIWASVGGMTGVAIIMAGQLGQSTYNDGALLGIAAVLASTVFYAYNLILARQQALVAKPIEISFFQNLALTVILGLAGPWLAVAAPVELWPGIAAATALSLSGILLMSWAYARAEAQRLIPMEYTAFVWAILLGWFMFGEAVGWTTLAGAALIIVGCLIAARTKPELAEPIEPAGI
ncbi:MAG: DMT family transporter [Rhizobiaceae bacterium]